MMMDDKESCSSSRMLDWKSNTNNNNNNTKEEEKKKVEVYKEVVGRLKESGHPDSLTPSFDEQLWSHFNRLPTRYALDVNVERAEDVVTHQRLLLLARHSIHRPVFDIRLVQVPPVSDGNSVDSSYPTSPTKQLTRSTHPPPVFGSSPNLEALALESSKSPDDDGDVAVHPISKVSRPMHEITFSTVDKPKLLSQLTSLLAEVGLNIQEAHAFSTVDGYSLDVFVVDGWPYEEVERLRFALEKELLKLEEQALPNQRSLSPLGGFDQAVVKCEPEYLTIPNDGCDVWEIDPQHLKYEYKVASGSYGDLYKGIYCSQEVAIKILKAEHLNSQLQKEFAQEVYIMRKVRHKNVVQFIGACTRPPNLCIVTEFMCGGSLYDYLHKQKGAFKLPSLLKVAIDVSKGMNYLHQNNIIHRDLKAANILMDENEVGKVADFGVARVKSQSGIMTAETGTYRWMAPEDGFLVLPSLSMLNYDDLQQWFQPFEEVIEHKPYDHKADVFSFGIVVWELLSGKLPYEYLTPLQAAIGVVQKGLRPTIPKHTHPKLVELLQRCWQRDSTLRPDFSEIIEILRQIAKEVGDEEEDRRKVKSRGFFSALRRGHQ